jgi:hypothetical protein
MGRSIFELPVQDVTGRIRPGATLTVRNQSDNELADIYENEEGGSPIAGSVVTSGSDGYVKFYVDPGVYKLTLAYSTASKDFNSVEIGPTLRNSDAVLNSVTTSSYLKGTAINVPIVDGEAVIDWQSATVFRLTVDEEVTIIFENMPSTEQSEEQTIYIDVINGGSAPITLQSTYTFDFPGGLNLPLQESGRDYFVATTNNGTTITLVPLLDLKSTP